MRPCMRNVVPRRYAFILGKKKLHGGYQGVFVADRWLTRRGMRPKQDVGRRPLLLIGGTNITLNDQREWMGHFLASGMEAAAIDYPIGMDIVAHSYADFEVVRALMTDPGAYRNLFLNADDIIVPFKDTLQAVANFLPEENIMVVRGGHIDLIFQDWQRPVFTSFIRKIKSRQL